MQLRISPDTFRTYQAKQAQQAALEKELKVLKAELLADVPPKQAGEFTLVDGNNATLGKVTVSHVQAFTCQMPEQYRARIS